MHRDVTGWNRYCILHLNLPPCPSGLQGSYCQGRHEKKPSQTRRTCWMPPTLPFALSCFLTTGRCSHGFSPFAVTLHLSLLRGVLGSPACSSPWLDIVGPSVRPVCCKGVCPGADGHGARALLGLSLPLSLSRQGGPGQDDLQHHVHQGEPSPLPTSARCVPTAQQTHHLPRRTHLARRSVNPIPTSQNHALGCQSYPCCLPQSKGDSPASVTCSSLTQMFR